MSFYSLSELQDLTSPVSAISLSLIGGFGGIIGFYIPRYLADGEQFVDISHLMTYPTLFM